MEHQATKPEDNIDPPPFTLFGLNRAAEEVHETAKEKGFWDDGYNDNVYGCKIALIHSEVTEWLEAIRKEQGPEAEVEEMADIIIRLLDLYQARKNQGKVRHGLDQMVQYKADKNRGREKKHGNRF